MWNLNCRLQLLEEITKKKQRALKKQNSQMWRLDCVPGLVRANRGSGM
jgi:hypothetical protein